MRAIRQKRRAEDKKKATDRARLLGSSSASVSARRALHVALDIVKQQQLLQQAGASSVAEVVLGEPLPGKSLRFQAHILGASGRAKLLDAQATGQGEPPAWRMHGIWMKLFWQEMYAAKERAEREERRRKRASGEDGGIEQKKEKDEEDALVFDPLDVASVRAKAAFVCACLDMIRAEGGEHLAVPVPWRECLPKGILQCPQVAEYLRAWKRADARDEAYVRCGLAVAAPSVQSASSSGGDVKEENVKDVWERRAEAAGQRARCRMLGLSSEWSQSESSEDSSSSSSSSSSSDDDE
jgi:hypothetical protein